MTAPKLWHYRLPSINGEGWAEIVLSSDGFFAAVSDWGNYAFIWRNPGVDDFRKFFLRVPENWDYFAGKLAPEDTRGKEYDGEATLRAVKDEILEARKSGAWDAVHAREEWTLLSEYEDLAERGDFDDWSRQTTIDRPWEYGRMRWDHHLKTFCTVTLARLAETIRAELAREAA